MSYVMDGVAYHHELCIAAVHGEGCDWIHYGINEDAPEVFRGLVIPHTEAICRGERRQNFRRANGGVGLKAHTASLCKCWLQPATDHNPNSFWLCWISLRNPVIPWGICNTGQSDLAELPNQQSRMNMAQGWGGILKRT
jgi:hypothetical protein